MFTKCRSKQGNDHVEHHIKYHCANWTNCFPASHVQVKLNSIKKFK